MTRNWLKRLWLVPAGAIAFWALYLLSLTPDNAGPWKPEQALTAFAEIDGRQITIHNVRDFRYDRKGATITQENYLTQQFNLDDLQRIWFGLSHFGPFGLAHSFLSFEFKGGEFVVLSVEARQRPTQVYKPVGGMFRKYTKIYVMSTEEDVIGVRSHLRGERVLLYPVTRSSAVAREAFFLALVEDMNQLHTKPAFYHTLLDNCLTNLLKHAGDVKKVSLADIRIILPGHADSLTYAFGSTPRDIPFETARQKATINPKESKISDSNFSQKIRCGWQGYGGMQFPSCAAQE